MGDVGARSDRGTRVDRDEDAGPPREDLQAGDEGVDDPPAIPEPEGSTDEQNALNRKPEP